jgi:hypothetical protein
MPPLDPDIPGKMLADGETDQILALHTQLHQRQGDLAVARHRHRDLVGIPDPARLALKTSRLRVTFPSTI